MTTLAEQKKSILPYIQRSQEIDTLNPKVAYYCKKFAIEQGIQIPDPQPEISGILEALMTKLEQDKPKLDLRKEDGQECEAFAITVFNRADKQDRSGKANANTVKAFYVASVFIDILRQFDPNGELPADMEERQKYAAWKAADIRRALKEGRVPQAGPPVTEDDLGLPAIPDLKHDGTDPNPQDTATSASGGLPSLPSHPSVRQDDSAAAPGPLLPPPASVPGPNGTLAQGPACRFRPGSKVFYNQYDGPPVRGTVVSVNHSDTYGNLYQVGLATKVMEIREDRLAFDFSDGDLVQYTPASGTTSQGTVEKSDTSRWPIAYLVLLHELGDTVATEEHRLKPAEASKAAPTAPLPVQPHSPTRSLPGEAAAGGEPGTGAADISTRDSQIAGPSHSGEDTQGDDLDGVPSQTDLLPGSSAPLPSGDSGTVEVDDPALPPFAGTSQPPADSHHSDMSRNGPPGDSGYPSLNQGAEHFNNFFPNPTQDIPGLRHLPPPHDPTTAAGTPPPPAIAGYPDLNVAPGFGHSQPGGPPAAVRGPEPPMAPQQVSQQSQSILQAQMSGASLQDPPYKPTLQAITEAQKFSKHAANALSFEDVPTASKLLQQALDLLRGPQSH